MNDYCNEEGVGYWTRGELRGEWSLSHRDILEIFGPDSGECPAVVQANGRVFAGKDSMLPHMTSPDAMAYNVDYRDRQAEKMRLLPWDVNMLNAYHNLHYICYMADILPDFSATPGRYRMDVPGRDLWILELIMEAATKCLRDDLVAADSAEGDRHRYRASPRVSDGIPGFWLHVTGLCVFGLSVEFRPTADGPLGFRSTVTLDCDSWDGERYALSGRNAPDTPLLKGMVRMKNYVRSALDRFREELAAAEFNRVWNDLSVLGKE